MVPRAVAGFVAGQFGDGAEMAAVFVTPRPVQQQILDGVNVEPRQLRRAFRHRRPTAKSRAVATPTLLHPRERARQAVNFWFPAATLTARYKPLAAASTGKKSSMLSFLSVH